MWELFEQRFEAEYPLAAVVWAQTLIDRLVGTGGKASGEALRAELDKLSYIDLRAFYNRTVQLTGGPTGQVEGDALAERWLPYRERLLALRAAGSAALNEAGPKPGQLTVQDLESTQACAPIDARIEDAIRAAFADRATEKDAADLAAAVRDYRAVAARVRVSEGGRRLLRFKIGRVLDGLARAKEASGHDAGAEVHFGAAAEMYTDAGEQKMAAAAIVRRDAARQRQVPDADTRLEQLLAGLDTARQGSVERATVLVGMAEVANGNSDDFEASRRLTDAIAEIREAGYPIPGPSGSDAAVEGWIGAIPPGNAEDPTHFLRLFSTLLTLHSRLAALRIALTPQSAGSAQADLNHFAAITLEMPVHIQAVEDRLEAQLAQSRPPGAEAAEPSPEPGERHQPGAEPVSRSDLGLDFAPGPEFMAVMAVVNQLVDLTEHAAGADPETIARWQQMADDCISRSRALGQPVTLAQALEAGGRVKLAANDADAAVALFEEEYQAVCGVGGKLATDQAILAMTSVAKVQLGREKIKEASEAAGRVIDLIERDRYRVSAPFQQAALLAPHEDIFAIGVFAAWQMAIDGTAPDRSAYDTMLQRMELSKARASVRKLFLTRSSGASVLDEELTAANNAIHALDPVIEGGTEEDQKKRREQARDDQLRLREQRLQLWDRRAISMRDPDATVPPVTLTGLQEALDPDEAVLYYYWLRPNTLLVVTINAEAIAVERRRVEPWQTALLQKLIGQLGSMKGSNLDLYANCIEPLAPLLTPREGQPLLDGKRRLIVSPHRMLHWYPFGTLPYQGAPLVRAFALRYAPNLTSLLVPRSTPGARRMIALAVSEFPGRPGLGELSEVRTEAADATAAYSAAGIPATLMAEPSRAEVLSALRDGTVAGAWCLVVATHEHSLTDEVAKDAPLESVLELADDSVDGYEIAADNLGCEVVVLTACYAGQRAIRGRGRPEQPGDELFGLGAAFLEARCRNVLAPTWPADDDAMPGIITAFHRNVAQGLPADLALAQAQRGFLDQADDITRNAYYWASLTLTAIGRPVPVPQARLPQVRPSKGDPQ